MRLLRSGTALSSVASFAGIGAGKPAVKKSEDKKPGDKKPEAEGDDEEMRSRQEEEVAAGAAKRRPEDKDEDGDEAEDEDEDKDEEGGDDSDDADMRERGKKASSARLRERARIAKIMSHPTAAANPDLALSLALQSNMSRTAVCNVLNGQTGAAAASATLNNRMLGIANQHVGPSAVANTKTREQEIDASWDRATAKFVPTRAG